MSTGLTPGNQEGTMDEDAIEKNEAYGRAIESVRTVFDILWTTESDHGTVGRLNEALIHGRKTAIERNDAIRKSPLARGDTEKSKVLEDFSKTVQLMAEISRETYGDGVIKEALQQALKTNK